MARDSGRTEASARCARRDDADEIPVTGAITGALLANNAGAGYCSALRAINSPPQLPAAAPALSRATVRGVLGNFSRSASDSRARNCAARARARAVRCR